jgi:mannose/fructose/N-acetylgalactosamine-specific phosphotransferase system component IID
MDYDRELEDEDGLKTATFMRNDYQALADSLGENYELNKGDAAKLLVGAMIMVNQLQDRLNALKKAMTGYQTDVIPKLKKIVDEAENDEEAIKMANEEFIIENNN